MNNQYYEDLKLAYEQHHKMKKSWPFLAARFNEKYGTSLTGSILRKRCNRYMKRIDTPSSTNEQQYETRYDDGTIEASKIVQYSASVFGDKRKLIEYLGYDPDMWEFKYVKTSIWEQKTRNDNSKTPMYAVKYKLRPKGCEDLNSVDFVEAAKDLFKKEIIPFTANGLAYNTQIKTNLDDTKLMLIPQIEAHLGKLSNEIETGVNYDHMIVKERVKTVFEEAANLQAIQRCGRCLVVIGGDFFNSESNNQTTAGTPQTSTDTRFKKMFQIGLELYTAGILMLKQRFNHVDVMLCAGNHSRAMEFFLYMALTCYFRNEDKITFSTDYKDTQSYVFGNCGLFFNHGDANQKRLIGSIPAEFYKEYGETIYRYLLVGHLHKLEVINTENGLTLHRVPAICENDGWHYQNRFGIGTVPSHEILIFDKNRGMLSNNFIYF